MVQPSRMGNNKKKRRAGASRQAVLKKWRLCESCIWLSKSERATHLEFAIRRQESSEDILVRFVRMIIRAGYCFLITDRFGDDSSVNLVRFIGIGIVVRNGFGNHRFTSSLGWRSPIIFVRFVGLDRVEIRLPSVLWWLGLLHCRTSPTAGERVIRLDERVVIGLERIKVIVVDGIDRVDGFLLCGSVRKRPVTVGRRRTIVISVLSFDIRQHHGQHTGDELKYTKNTVEKIRNWKNKWTVKGGLSLYRRRLFWIFLEFVFPMKCVTMKEQRNILVVWYRLKCTLGMKTGSWMSCPFYSYGSPLCPSLSLVDNRQRSAEATNKKNTKLSLKCIQDSTPDCKVLVQHSQQVGGEMRLLSLLLLLVLFWNLKTTSLVKFWPHVANKPNDWAVLHRGTLRWILETASERNWFSRKTFS